MKLKGWMTMLAVTGAMASAPLLAQDIQRMESPSMGSSSVSEDKPWADQRASLDSVKKLQESLIEKGYDVGPVDGLIGPQTQAALQKFQEDQGLDASGEINVETLTALEIDDSEFAAFGIEEEEVTDSPSVSPESSSSPQDSRAMDRGTMREGDTTAPDSGIR